MMTTNKMPTIPLDDVLSVRGDTLFIEERAVPTLADEFGTPLYVTSEQQLRANIRRFQRAFQKAWHHGPVDILASFKATQALAIRAILNEEGAGCDCFGAGELYGAMTARVAPHLVSLNGSFKDETTVRNGIAYGARITLDDAYELDLVERIAAELGVVATVRIRLRPYFGEIEAHSDLRDEFALGMALHVGKYGVPAESLVQMAQQAMASPHVDLAGFHFHGGRHSLDPAVWEQIGEGIAVEIVRICASLGGYRPREIDCGGGFPSPRDAVRRALDAERDRPVAPPIEAFANALTSGLAAGLEAGGVSPAGVRFQVEPGRSLYADTCIHVVRVRGVKATATPVPWRWIGTDTSVINLHDIPFLHARFDHVVANRAADPPSATADIVGITCMVDRITPDAAVPASIQAGDVIAFLGTGAYQEAGSGNFNGLSRPASILVHGDEAAVIRRAETPADVFARDIVPSRLAGA